MVMEGVFRYMIKKNYMDALLSLEFKDDVTIKNMAETARITKNQMHFVVCSFIRQGVLKKIDRPKTNFYIVQLTQKGEELIKAFVEIKAIVEEREYKEKPKEEKIEREVSEVSAGAKIMPALVKAVQEAVTLPQTPKAENEEGDDGNEEPTTEAN